jgi:hypothetical protein
VPGPAGTPGGDPDPSIGAPVTVSDTPAAPAADLPLLPSSSQPPHATRSGHGSSSSSSSGGTRMAPPRDGTPTHGLASSLFVPPAPTGVTRAPAPRAQAAPPAARATPVRERGRRGGGGGDHRAPFGPDPTTPLVASGASGGSSGFVLILLLALAAAVVLLDPAGLSMRVAAAVARGPDRTDRRIDRPG